MALFNTVSCNEVIGTSDGCSFACCNKEPQGLLQIWKDNGSEKERLNGTQITNGLTEVEASIIIGMDRNQQFTCRATSEICPMHTIPITCTVGSVLKLKCILVVRQDNSTCSHSQVQSLLMFEYYFTVILPSGGNYMPRFQYH